MSLCKDQYSSADADSSEGNGLALFCIIVDLLVLYIDLTSPLLLSDISKSDLIRLLRDSEEREQAQQREESFRSDTCHSPPRENESDRFEPLNGGLQDVDKIIPTEGTRLLPSSSFEQPGRDSISSQFDTESLWQTAKNVLDRCFQPPVVGGIAGIICAVSPARGVFVDLVHRNSSAPLQWLFDGLYAVGLTAVPINMIILGCNLSSSSPAKQATVDEKSTNMLSTRTMVGIVVGKMIVQPFIGILSGWFLKNYVWDIPADIDGAFYLVLMIVFLTPTANNVMVMVELSGSGAKEGIARVIALQYAVAPLILSLTMTIAIGVSSGWSS